jgi:lipid-binding SYLF domain-containing protein
MKTNSFKQITYITLLFALLSSFSSADIVNEPAEVINAKADVAVQQFYKEVKGGEAFLSKVKGYLVFPSVVKAGFLVGGEYGEGVLRVNGKNVGYYSIASGSVGFQMGVQQTSYVIAFVSQDALDKFIRSNGWEAGVDGAVTVAKWGAGTDISTISYQNPIYAFVFGAKGLMYNLNLEGTKFTKIQR